MKLKLIEKLSLFEDVVSFTFEPEIPVEWKAGQYFHYILPHENADDRGIERWFTISSAPFEKNLKITTRFTADKGSSFKNTLKNLEVGAELEGDGPEGSFTIEDFSKKYVFIVGGIGVTPLRSIITQAAHEGQNINAEVLYANRDANYVYEDDLNTFAMNQPNFKIHKFTNPKLIEEDDIRKVVLDLNEPVYYITGPKPMVENYQKVLMNMGVSEEMIKMDDFPGYDKI